MNNQEELFKPDTSLPIEDVAKLPEGTTDELQPFESSDKIKYRNITPEAYDGEKSNISRVSLDELALMQLPKKTPEDIYKEIQQGVMYSYSQDTVYKEPAILAIDPGANGALAVLTNSGIVFTHKMPETPKDLFDLLKTIQIGHQIECTLEKVGGMPKMGGSSMFNFGKGYGYLEMALIALEIKTTTVSPQAWQKTFLIGTKSKLSTTEWKNKLKAKAQQLYPHLKVTLGNADALLILEYAKNLRK